MSPQKGERQRWQGAQAPPDRCTDQLTALELKLQRPRPLRNAPPARRPLCQCGGVGGSVGGIPRVLGTSSVLSSWSARDFGTLGDLRTEGTRGSLLGAAAALWPMKLRVGGPQPRVRITSDSSPERVQTSRLGETPVSPPADSLLLRTQASSLLPLPKQKPATRTCPAPGLGSFCEGPDRKDFHLPG